MSVDIIARSLARAATPVAATATEIPTLQLALSVGVIQTSGYAVAGTGAGLYVSDALATLALATVHPRFCKQSLDGRYWRLLPAADGLIHVAAGGAAATASENNSANHQPIIDAARAYCEAIAASGLAFDDGYYSIWTPLRTETPAANVNFNINANQTGVPFVLNKRQIWQAGPRETFFVRRKTNGTATSTFAGTQQLTSGQYWRGGMFLLKGTVSAPADPLDEAALTLRGNWDIDGGVGVRSGIGLLPLVSGMYVLNAAGNGWDISDKPVWGENDRRYGDFNVDGYAKIHGFRGELIYHGNYGAITIRGTLDLYDTDGNGFNPDSRTFIRADTVNIHDCFNGMEAGSGDEESWIHNLVIKDCITAGTMRGGVSYSTLTSPNPTNVFRIDNLRVSRSAQFVLARYTHIGEAVIMDSRFDIGSTAGGTDNGLAVNSSVDSLTILADRMNINPGVQFGAESVTPGTKGTRRNVIGRVTFMRTPYAIANGFTIVTPITSGGYSLGEGNWIGEVCGEADQYPTGANVDHAVGYGKIAMTPLVNDFSLLHDLTAVADLSYNNGPMLRVYESGNPATGQKVATLATVGPALKPPNGSVWTIINGGSRPVVIDTTNTRMPYRVIIPNGSRNLVRFEFDGTFWGLIEKPARIRGTAVYDPANLVDGAGVTTTVTVVGAVLGMAAGATFSLDLQGVILLAWVSAADTVSVRFQNETGGAIDLASATITATADYV